MNFIKLYEDFTKKSIPEELKFISNEIKKDLLKNGNADFNKEYAFGDYKFIIDVDYIKKDTEPYYSNINLFDILINGNFDNILIPITVRDHEIDFYYLISVITHELRHIYDIFSINNEYEGEDFVKELGLQKYKMSPFYNFTYLIYISLEHELIARNNMLYTYLSGRNNLNELYKNSYIYKSLIMLKEFNSKQFVLNYKKDLLKTTNDFIQDFAKDNNLCFNQNDLLEYFKKWEEFFKLKSSEYLKYADDIITDVKNEVKFENQGYKEKITIKDIFNQFYDKYIK